MKLTIHDDPEALEKRIRALKKNEDHERKSRPARNLNRRESPPGSTQVRISVPGKGFNKPLFDTGALYDAFDYEIEE